MGVVGSGVGEAPEEFCVVIGIWRYGRVGDWRRGVRHGNCEVLCKQVIIYISIAWSIVFKAEGGVPDLDLE